MAFHQAEVDNMISLGINLWHPEITTGTGFIFGEFHGFILVPALLICMVNPFYMLEPAACFHFFRIRTILDFELLFPLFASTGYNWADTAATAEILTKFLLLIGIFFKLIELFAVMASPSKLLIMVRNHG